MEHGMVTTWSRKEAGRGLGVCIILRLAHCRVGEDGVVLFGEDFPGEEASFDIDIVGAGLRIVDGVWIVFLRIEVGAGRFGERFDKGSGRSIFLLLS